MRASPSTGPICLLLLAAACGAPADDLGHREPDLALEADEVELDRVEQSLGGSCGTQNTTFDRFVTATVVAVSSQGRGAFAAAQAETARLARERAIFSGAQPVRLHTLFTGNGKCFDVINDALDNRVTMNDSGNFSGQLWTISAGPVAGTFRLKSQFTGANRCLDIIGGQVSLGTCGSFTGQA